MPPLLGCVAASGTRERGLVGGMAADRVGPNRPRRLAYFYSTEHVRTVVYLPELPAPVCHLEHTAAIR